MLAYIDVNLDSDLTVERLSEVAAFSKFHFHRQFSEHFGIGVYKFVQLSRLKRASYLLAYRDDQSITDIALGCGYEGPEAFARAFRKNIGQSPSEFRKKPLWNEWHTMYQPLNELRSKHMKPENGLDNVKIINFLETRVAVFGHRGDPQLLGDSIRQFIAWRKQNKLPPSVSATFNIVYDDPVDTQPDAYRFDLCAATDREITPNEFGVVGKVIPAGRCAVLRHIGSDDHLAAAVTYLYGEWLPQSGEEMRDFPLFLQRVKFFPDVAEHEVIVDIFLPLK
ncbi:MAG: AraC family transcriptional regulator [Verrucomicrobiaceae bacterium]|nr:AraC family transcriptional regulator [Verrucomicrobiaceae bacterium]